MPLCSATNECRLLATCFALMAACSGPGHYEPGVLTAEQRALCVAVEGAYRAQSPEYAALRDQAAADPIVTGWLVRMFVRDLFVVREGRPIGKDEGLLRAAAKITDPVESRAIAEIKQLGVLAVPTLIGDLLKHEQSQPRELGIELLAEIGTPAVPALREVADSGEPKQQRAAARALGAIGVDPAALVVLRRLANDSDYTVRADAMRGLRTGGPNARDLLLERLVRDDDAFVRRVAAQTLGWFSEPAVAGALVDYLERCKRERDFPGEQAAQGALQRIAGTHRPRTAEAWRSFVTEMNDNVGTGR